MDNNPSSECRAKTAESRIESVLADLHQVGAWHERNIMGARCEGWQALLSAALGFGSERIEMCRAMSAPLKFESFPVLYYQIYE